jgi:2-polyprenyl-6-methoxyphenol hydroxylase-like FAD-dependent oxidoreductase
MQQHGEHAIVIGASMGGLAAAAALAEHFERVTVVERDELPSSPQPRRGVPQGKHAHGLQPGGLVALEGLLPGLTAALSAGGAPTGDLAGEAGWYVGGGWLARSTAGVPGVGLTRPYLEHQVRVRVAARPGVILRDRTQVSALTTARDVQGRIRVTGVEIADGARRLAADLVVDASGRNSALPAWLRGFGYPMPDEERVHCKMAYLTRRWLLRDGALGSDVLTVIAPAGSPMFGVLIAQEDGSHIVTLGGLLSNGPARNDDAYLAFARRLPDPRIADALEGGRPLTELQPSHFPFSVRRRYDKLAAFPAGLLAIGDAIASFNPMYGQGMTVAALQAVALRDQLGRGPLRPRRFFRAAHKIEDVAWRISTGGDLRFPTVQGRRTLDMKLMNRYLDRLLSAARSDPLLAQQFLRVSAFIDPPQSLFKASVIRRVLTAGPPTGRSKDRPSLAVRELR